MSLLLWVVFQHLAWHSLLQYFASLQFPHRLIFSQMTPQPKHAAFSFLEFMSASLSKCIASWNKSIKFALNTKQLSIFSSTINIFSCFSAQRMATVLPCFKSDQENVVGSSSLSYRSRFMSSPNGVKPLQHLYVNILCLFLYINYIFKAEKQNNKPGMLHFMKLNQ